MIATSNSYTPLSRTEIAARVARDIAEGWYVNLGIGIPTLIADQLPADKEVIFQSENGILGLGPAPAPDQVDPWLTNAGKQNATLRKGASLFHHADSFTMIRGGHLDLCVLGAYQVAENGDMANWAILGDDGPPAVGGAMDLAVGARRTWVVMEQTSKDGKPKLVHRCTFPLTGMNCVSRIYTNLAVFDVTPRGFVVIDMVDGMTLEQLRELCDAEIHRPS